MAAADAAARPMPKGAPHKGVEWDHARHGQRHADHGREHNQRDHPKLAQAQKKLRSLPD